MLTTPQALLLSDEKLTAAEAQAFYDANFATMSPAQEDEIIQVIRELEDAEWSAKGAAAEDEYCGYSEYEAERLTAADLGVGRAF